MLLMRQWLTAGGLCLSLLLSGCDNSGSAPPPAKPTTLPPNILFIILDDIGIDQFRTFGYGGLTPPALPNIDQIADAGIHFRNTWSMPACSVSRAVFFSGRFPLRTNLYAALGPDDLAKFHALPLGRRRCPSC
jgi:arylsulfatase A-like enzyme